ncbi:MAG TPA: DUF2277 domain-containing protein [Candidatus Saccharimonadales bacterium]|nr:DUF2277 domain-containing protein [Candidatus Saccharimonadales bacterium]
MCRNIKPLFNFDPPASDDEIRAAATQFVRKITGFTHPSAANEAAFQEAVEEITHTAKHMLGALHTHAGPKNREAEAAKARARSAGRFSAD